MTEWPPRHDIVNVIFHDDAAFYGFEAMLVVPEGKRALTLLIDKPFHGLDMPDFSQPNHRYAQNSSDAVFDDEARMDGFRNLAPNLKVEKRRCHDLEIFRGRKKRPCFLEGHGEILGLLYAVNFHVKNPDGFACELCGFLRLKRP